VTERVELSPGARGAGGADRVEPPAGAVADVEWRHAPDVLVRETVDRVVVLPRHAPAPLTLRGTAPDVWRLFAEPRSVRDASTELARSYGADVSLVAADVHETVEHLAAQGALCVVARP
jgi:hypothetical protein